MATTDEIQILHVADHEDRCVELVPLVDRVRPGRKSVFRFLGLAFQDLEDTVYDVAHGMPLDMASGVVLNIWGFIAGVRREGLTDRWYRRLIGAAFLAKHSVGTVDHCILIWSQATGAFQTEFVRYPNTCIVLTAFVDDWMPETYARRAAEVTRRGCPVGATVLLETTLPYTGSDSRTRTPLPGVSPASSTGTKVW